MVIRERIRVVLGAPGREIFGVSKWSTSAIPYFWKLGNDSATWMSQEVSKMVSKWVITPIYPIYK